jgi:crotonobetainyl-CoA:carnitine CoA-transferase CaiB-like acyl-CoA transferase
MAHHIAIGKTMEAATGMSSLIGYPAERTPGFTGPLLLDPIGGIHGAAACLLALAFRQRSGRGGYVEVAQTDAALQYIGEYLLQELETGAHQGSSSGNIIPYAAPHDAFRASGEDEWVAIAVFSDDDWQRLGSVIGINQSFPELEFATLEARLARAEEIRAAIESWTRGRDKCDTARELQAHGLCAAPVLNGREIAGDAALWQSGFYQWLEHPLAGQTPYPGLGLVLGRTPGQMTASAPLFGQHNEYVARQIAGLTSGEYDDLTARGVLVDRPVT